MEVIAEREVQGKPAYQLEDDRGEEALLIVGASDETDARAILFTDPDGKDNDGRTNYKLVWVIRAEEGGLYISSCTNLEQRPGKAAESIKGVNLKDRGIIPNKLIQSLVFGTYVNPFSNDPDLLAERDVPK